MVKLEDIFQDRLSSLGIREIMEPHGLKKAFTRPHVKCCRRIALSPYQEGAIIIVSAGAQEKLIALSPPLRREFFAQLNFCKTALLIFSQSETLPAPLKKLLQRHHMPTAISFLHDNLLESRIKALIREKIQQRITIQGVALEIHGKGILITGASGIGKTTTAIQAMPEGYLWIADDLAVIRKDQRGKLIISGHRKIKNYLHTGEIGIVAVDHMLNASQIKNKTELAAVIEVIRTDAGDVSCQLSEKNILENRLPCLRMTISQTGYFNKNLLKQAVQKLKEGG
jgi:serine kinase of HPr protein (carbohydrate metabolism regulator)